MSETYVIRTTETERIIIRELPAPLEITIGSTTTIQAGNPATVTNVGTPSAPVLEFEIPRGDTEYVGNVDGGHAASVYGGIPPLDGGTP